MVSPQAESTAKKLPVRPVVILPAYNNAGTLYDFISRLLPWAMLHPFRSRGAASPDAAGDSDAWRRGELTWIVLLLAWAMLLRLGYIFLFRFGSDEPQHLHVAWSWAHGQMQYRDVFDNHTPLFHMLCAPLVWLLGDHYYLLYQMRLALVPVYGVTLWGAYRLARTCLPVRLSGWVVALTGLFPLFFAGSVEFRTDDLWMATFTFFLAVLLGARLTPWRSFLAGLLLGITISVSMKTSLLLACLAPAVVVTPLLCLGRYPLPRPAKAPWLCLPALLLGTALVPGGITAWFYLHGALGQLYYGVILHNMLPKLGGYKHFEWRRLLFIPVAGWVLIQARWFIRHDRFGARTPTYVLLFLFAGFYIAALKFIWPLVTQQSFLPVWPAVMIVLAPLLDRPLPRWIQKRLHPNRDLASAWGLLLACVMLEFIILATPFTWVRYSHVTKEIATWKAVLKLTRPDEAVMDPKGELIFRKRAFYWGMEKITRTRMDRGLIPDTIRQCLTEQRVCVVYPYADRYLRNTRKFINANYILVGPLRVAGKMILAAESEPAAQIPFSIDIVAQYDLVTPHGPARGMLDGKPVSSATPLTAGRHVYRPAPGERRVALLWSRAAGQGFTPFREKLH